ncbi:MAG TPA: type II toxin-antitoxin system VapC family toxin [Oscillatoriaceae cyanobacterium M33_DOE_052]|uniref:Type II toxin-antitoxin system VapC family toxin n=1 Tax=Planktothricoides sp. SpSt-374 TaxID=2282167 RepID=A0A7C3ZK76_9CYAN|nr:type II toxin-antitoxin system VapC family toxin [Oscillatoriaceae cyanobacterium M33_DOE_052]
MKLLLDNHIFLWFIQGDSRLSEKFHEAIQNQASEVFLSVVSIWECVIKYQMGKLDFPESPVIYLPQQRAKHLIKSLVVDEASIAQLINLPPLHRDPFDRLLICQALQHNLMIVTEDQAILSYPMVSTLR